MVAPAKRSLPENQWLEMGREFGMSVTVTRWNPGGYIRAVKHVGLGRS